MNKAKPLSIFKREVWALYKYVKANRGVAEVDGQTIAEFEKELVLRQRKYFAKNQIFPKARAYLLSNFPIKERVILCYLLDQYLNMKVNSYTNLSERVIFIFFKVGSFSSLFWGIFIDTNKLCNYYKDHKELARAIRRYIAWRNRNVSHPDILKEQCKIIVA